jgi:hypothetical protein
VLLTPDEETASHASVALITEGAKRCSFGLVFEPARATGIFRTVLQDKA